MPQEGSDYGTVPEAPALWGVYWHRSVTNMNCLTGVSSDFRQGWESGSACRHYLSHGAMVCFLSRDAATDYVRAGYRCIADPNGHPDALLVDGVGVIAPLNEAADRADREAG